MAHRMLQRLPEPEEPSSQIARWIRLAEEHRQLLRRIGLGFSVLIISVSTFIFGRTLIGIDPSRFEAAFAATGADQIAEAFGLATISYLALTGYDGLALRHLGVRVPYRLTALASFTSYAISFTLGFPLVTGGAVRFWLYGPAGLSAGKVASLTVVAGVTFWLGMGLVLGIGFIGDAEEIGEINHLASWANRGIGLALFAVLIAYLIWVAPDAPPRQGRLPQFQTAGPDVDARTNRPRRHRCLRGGGHLVRPAAQGPRSRLCRVLRTLFFRRDARHRQSCAGRARRVRGDDAEGSRRLQRSVARFVAAVPRHLLSSRRSCLRSRCWARTRRCGVGVPCARRWKPPLWTAGTSRGREGFRRCLLG